MASSRSVEKLLLNIRADLKDLKNLQLELETVRKKGKEVETGISEGIKNALATLGASFTTLKIKGVFDGAVADANRLEKTMLGLQATAKLTGNSFAQIKSAVTNLSKDGVLSIDQASQSMKVLLAQGVAADKAFQLVDAAKKVGAFNNIVGDTGQAVQDFIKFLQTGSNELAENLDPSLVKVIKSLGGYEAVANNAAAKQKLINAVIEKGSALTGDYEKFLQSGSQAAVTYGKAQERLSQNFGEKLAPAYSKVLSLGAQLIGGIADIIKGFSSFSVSVVSFSALGVAAFVTLGGAAVTFGIVSKAAFTAALGPIGLIVTAVSGLLLVLNAFSPPNPDELVKSYQETSGALDELAAKTKSIEKLNVRTIEQNGELAKSQIDLRQRAKELGVDYDELASKIKNVAEQSQALKNIAREQAAAILRERLDSLDSRRAVSRRFSTGEKVLLAFGVPGFAGAAQIFDRDTIDADIKETRAAYIKLYQSETAAQQQAAAVGGVAKPEARYIKTRDDIKAAADALKNSQARYSARQANLAPLRDAVQREYEKAVKKYGEDDNRTLRVQFRLEKVKNAIDEAQKDFNEAGLKFTLDSENLKSQLRQQVAEYVEDKFTAETEAANQLFNKQIENIHELVNTKAISEEEAESQLAKIREEFARKEAAIRAKSFNETLTAADNIVKGFGALNGASSAGGALSGVGSVFGGIGGLKSQFTKGGIFGENSTLAGLTGGLATAAPLISLGGSIVSGISNIFSKSQSEMEAEAAAAERRHQEALIILKLQENHQKNLLALSEAQAKLPFEDLQRKQRLIDIRSSQSLLAGQDPKAVESQRLQDKLAAVQDTLTSQAGTISGGQLFSGTGSTPDELIKFLSERAKQSVAVSQFTQLLQQLPGITGPGSLGAFALALEQLESYNGLIPNELYSVVQPIRNQLNAYNDARFARNGRSLGQTSQLSNDLYGSVVPSAIGRANSITSEIGIDTGVAENLLGVIEQGNQLQLDIRNNTAETAANTSKLAQLDDRKVSYLDLGEKRVISRGFNVSVDRLKLPDSVASTVLASSASPSVPSDTLAAFRKMIELAEESNDYLAMIAANTDSKASTNTDDFETRLVAKLLELKGRRVAA